MSPNDVVWSSFVKILVRDIYYVLAILDLWLQWKTKEVSFGQQVQYVSSSWLHLRLKKKKEKVNIPLTDRNTVDRYKKYV